MLGKVSLHGHKRDLGEYNYFIHDSLQLYYVPFWGSLNTFYSICTFYICFFVTVFLCFYVIDSRATLCKMNTEDKLEGMLLKCSSGGIDGGGKVGLGSGGGLVVMTLGERSLANHPLLAEDDDDEDDDEDLTRSSLVTHDLVPPEQLMMQEEMMKNSGGGEEEGGAEVGEHFPLKLTNKFPCLLHMPVSSRWFRSRSDFDKLISVSASTIST